MPNVVPIPPDVFEQFCEDDPEMASQVVKQLHESAQAKRQQRLNEQAEDES